MMSETRVHPYAGEVRMIAEKLEEAGFEPRWVHDTDENIKTPTWDEVRSTVLAVDWSNIGVFDPETKKEVVVEIVLDNEPGVAISDWTIPNESVNERMNKLSKEIAVHFGAW